MTCNQLELTKQCIESVKKYTSEAYELIIVDHGSTDGTLQYLEQDKELVIIKNESNLGIAKGCNQGVEVARGNYFLFLNNNTIVTSGWLTAMIRECECNDRVGMVGPVTNYASGHHQIQVAYTELSELDQFAEDHVRKYANQSVEVRRLVGFCLLVKRAVLEEIGGFDERYGMGNYEDDDLCLRAIQAGYQLKVVYDSFIHHIPHATMNKLEEEALQRLLAENKQKARIKWGEDIHQLLYAEAASVTVCLLQDADNSELTYLKKTLRDLSDVAEEVLVMYVVNADEAVHENEKHNAVIDWLRQENVEQAKIKFYEIKGKLEHARVAVHSFAQELATKDYIVWLPEGEVITKQEARRLAGIKLTIKEQKVDYTWGNHRPVIRRK